jgi:hypothetical protein
MSAETLGLRSLAGAAAATAASPRPKVFSSVRGLETYSSRFVLEVDGERIALTPDRYAALRGPYNRRNAYGAVSAYGPVLASDPATAPLFDAVARHALCGEAPLLRELGVRAGASVRLHVEPRPGTSPEVPLSLELACS